MGLDLACGVGPVSVNSLARLTVPELLDRSGTLLVLRSGASTVEPILCISAQGEILAFCGHVDLGTGLRTALAQIVAEELGVAEQHVNMVLGDTARAPNQGATIASESIQTAAQPLRKAAAQALNCLLRLASERLQIDTRELGVEEGWMRARDGAGSASFKELIGAARIRLELNMGEPVKPPAEYRVVGKSALRVDIPAKAAGEAVYVHDVRVDGMLHGRVVRPPYAGVDHGPFVGTSLIAVDKGSVAHIGGIVAVIAEREEQAAEAAEALQVEWKSVPQLRDLDDLATALSTNPSTERRLEDKGDVDAALGEAAQLMPRRYLWPYQLHGSIGPSCGIADDGSNGATIWSGTQNPHELQRHIAL